jgi:hypothetical protein
MKKLKSFLKGDLLGVHLAVNIFIATTVLWLLLRLGAATSPIWAISAMIPALDPQMKQAVTNFRGRIFNALLGCVTGLLFLLVGGTSEWKPSPVNSAVAIRGAEDVSLWREHHVVEDVCLRGPTRVSIIGILWRNGLAAISFELQYPSLHPPQTRDFGSVPVRKKSVSSTPTFSLTSNPRTPCAHRRHPSFRRVYTRSLNFCQNPFVRIEKEYGARNG